MCNCRVCFLLEQLHACKRGYWKHAYKLWSYLLLGTAYCLDCIFLEFLWSAWTSLYQRLQVCSSIIKQYLDKFCLFPPPLPPRKLSQSKFGSIIKSHTTSDNNVLIFLTVLATNLRRSRVAASQAILRIAAFDILCCHPCLWLYCVAL